MSISVWANTITLELYDYLFFGVGMSMNTMIWASGCDYVLVTGSPNATALK
jgi:hypothetical protein